MKKFLKSKLGKCFLYTLLCVFVFAVTNLLIGWLVKDYMWLYEDIRPAIFLFVVLNLFIDVIAILRIDLEIEFM